MKDFCGGVKIALCGWVCVSVSHQLVRALHKNLLEVVADCDSLVKNFTWYMISVFFPFLLRRKTLHRCVVVIYKGGRGCVSTYRTRGWSQWDALVGYTYFWTVWYHLSKSVPPSYCVSLFCDAHIEGLCISPSRPAVVRAHIMAYNYWVTLPTRRFIQRLVSGMCCRLCQSARSVEMDGASHEFSMWRWKRRKECVNKIISTKDETKQKPVKLEILLRVL